MRFRQRVAANPVGRPKRNHELHEQRKTTEKVLTTNYANYTNEAEGKEDSNHGEHGGSQKGRVPRLPKVNRIFIVFSEFRVMPSFAGVGKYISQQDSRTNTQPRFRLQLSGDL